VVDFRPFRSLRYSSEAVSDFGSVLSPPFDVIDAEEHTSLHERSSYNVIRLELGEQRPDDGPQENRYTRGAATLAEWRESEVLIQDERPTFYVYVQEFEHEGQRRRRTSLLGRVRLEPWEAGSVLPHEETMSAPKEDRLQVLRHLRTNISPIFTLYRDTKGSIERLLSADGDRLVDAATPNGQHHTLVALSDAAAIDGVSTVLRDSPLYILDGHHRFETALAYRDERRAQAQTWTGEEPENFVMVAITSADDPGLVLLPIHRLVRPPAVPSDLLQRLERFFQVEDITAQSSDRAALPHLLGRLATAGSSGTAFGAAGLEKGSLHLLTLRDSPAVESLMPERSQVWRGLDVSVLEYAVLRETLGVQAGSQAVVSYTEDAELAVQEVESGRWPLAFLVNPTRVDQILAIADGDERMPPKSTYFYPKLATGTVLNPLD
jgi:uncharacterized protein (DUF1015 family)